MKPAQARMPSGWDVSYVISRSASARSSTRSRVAAGAAGESCPQHPSFGRRRYGNDSDHREETPAPTSPDGRMWPLVIRLAGTPTPTIYNTRDPELFGVPFFYWYQMAWSRSACPARRRSTGATRRRS